jgi:hypothetical protein
MLIKNRQLKSKGTAFYATANHYWNSMRRQLPDCTLAGAQLPINAVTGHVKIRPESLIPLRFGSQFT